MHDRVGTIVHMRPTNSLGFWDKDRQQIPDQNNRPVICLRN